MKDEVLTEVINVPVDQKLERSSTLFQLLYQHQDGQFIQINALPSSRDVGMIAVSCL